MGEMYALRLRGSSGVERIRAGNGQSPQAVFDAAVAARDISPDLVRSFYRAGRSIPLAGPHGGGARAGHQIPGEELIFQVRGLPDLGEDATMVHDCWLSSGKGPAIDPGALALTDRAVAALGELEDKGLVSVETCADGRFRHVLTDEGLARPTKRLTEAKYGIPFPMIERISIEIEAPETEDAGMSGP